MAVSLNRLRSGMISALGFNFLLAIGVVFLAASLVEAQQPPGQENRAERDRQEKAERERQMNEYLRRTNPPGPSGPRVLGIGPSPVKLSKEIKARLEIAPEVKAEYAAFLKTRNTGVFKLLSQGTEGDAFAISTANAGGMANPIFRATSTYSFREKEVGSWQSDIAYVDGKIMGTMATSHLLLTQLAVEDIASVTAETPGMPFLTNFAQAKTPEEVDEISARLAPGIGDGGFRYTTSTWPRVGKVYGLRLVAYGYRRGSVYSPGEKDLLIAFKIAARDEDGSVTVVWKELHRKDAPVFRIK